LQKDLSTTQYMDALWILDGIQLFVQENIP